MPEAGAQLRALAVREQAGCIVVREAARSVRPPAAKSRNPPPAERGPPVMCDARDIQSVRMRVGKVARRPVRARAEPRRLALSLRPKSV